jgi:signal transduction histidine kinase
MIPDENPSFKLAMSSTSEQESQRLQVLQAFDLLESGNVPIFDEATQTAAHFLNMPICVLGLLDHDRVWFKSAFGLSRIGLMNSLAASRQLTRQEAFCTRTVETERVLMITDTTMEPDWASVQLVQRFGIRSYLGVPLYTSAGQCIGTLAVMGLTARSFTEQEIAFLELTARWSMSEFEREQLQRQPVAAAPSVTTLASASTVKASLLSQMSQELCTPLTSILGMANVLNQGIYGTLSGKQQEYIQIIHNSGQYLVSLINEIVELGTLDDQSHELNLSAVDVEMLCQQAMAALAQAAQRRDLQLQLTVEPGNRIWLLDKDKVRHLLYHLVFSLIQASSPESTIRIHVSRKQSNLQMTVWSSHPWLNEDLPQTLTVRPLLSQSSRSALTVAAKPAMQNWTITEAETGTTQPVAETRESLGILLSRQLAALHSGEIMLQGSAETGYRYVIRLPQFKGSPES